MLRKSSLVLHNSTPFYTHYSMIDTLIRFGAWGMFIAAFLAGSIAPFPSEPVLIGLQVAGAPYELVVLATIGNTMGGMFNYWIGHFGKTEWIERYLYVSKERMYKTFRFMHNKGAWIGIWGFLPVIGDPITICLGGLKASPVISFLSIALGKAARYIAIAYTINLLV